MNIKLNCLTLTKKFSFWIPLSVKTRLVCGNNVITVPIWKFFANLYFVLGPCGSSVVCMVKLWWSMAWVHYFVHNDKVYFFFSLLLCQSTLWARIKAFHVYRNKKTKPALIKSTIVADYYVNYLSIVYSKVIKHIIKRPKKYLKLTKLLSICEISSAESG